MEMKSSGSLLSFFVCPIDRFKCIRLHTCQSIIQDVIFHVNQSIMPCNNAIHNVCLYASMSAVNMCQCSIYLCHMTLALAKKGDPAIILREYLPVIGMIDGNIIMQ